MSTTLATRFSEKISRPLLLMVLAAVAVVLGVLVTLYQKTLAPFSSGGIASLRTSASCTLPDQVSPTNERKQLFVSCAGFLD